MPDYRLYFLDQGGHIGGVVEMACIDDEAASKLAQAHNDGRAMELWRRDQKVRSFASDDAARLDDRPEPDSGISSIRSDP